MADFLLGCFFCGVDSRALLYFVVAFVVCMILATGTFLSWSIAKGDFNHVEQAKYDIFNDPEADDPENRENRL